MPMRILSVGYPLAAVSRSTPGGAEQILATLDEALVAAGEQSFVIAPLGSQVRGSLLPISAPEGPLDDEQRARSWRETQAAIALAVKRFSIDVIHLHGIDFLAYLPDPGVPVVVTLHLPPSWYPDEAFRLPRPDTYLCCVSNSQLRECPADANICGVIPNGVNVADFEPRWRKGDYVLSLGRICPEKGFHLAIEAADMAGVPLVLAGKVFGYRAHQEYFDEVLRPKLRAPHRFIGEVGGRRKQELLGGARCVLIPSLVSETSSLVAMEAMACGTPVVSFRRGALPEIVEHGRTGFVVDTTAQMAEAIEAAKELSPSICRETAETHFSADRMAEQYFQLYRAVATGVSVPQERAA